MTYTLTQFPGVIVRDEDQAFIPTDPGNIDYQDYCDFLEKGGVPNPVPPAIVPPIGDTPPPDIEEVNAQVQDIDARLSALEADAAAAKQRVEALGPGA